MTDAPFVEGVEVGWAGFFSLEIPKRSRNCRFSSCNRAHSAKASFSLCSMGVEAFNTPGCRNMIGHAMPNASKLCGQAAETEPQRALRLKLYGSLPPSRSNAPAPCVSTLTALASPGGMALRKARWECACLVQESACHLISLGGIVQAWL
jgi:hypothetical protein